MVNEEKYKSVILFFANRIKNQTLGKVKLMKLLYYLDFDFFEKHDVPVTGDVYYRLPFGPVPTSVEGILNKMVKEGSVKIVRQPMNQNLNDRQLIVPLKESNIQLLTQEEIVILEEVVCKWERFSGKEMVDASHGEAPFIATKPQQVIEYNLAYYRNKYNKMANM